MDINNYQTTNVTINETLGNVNDKYSPKNLREFYYKRQTLDLIIIILLVAVGSFWFNALEQLVRQHVFRKEEITPFEWALIATIASAIFLLVLKVLHTPVHMFA